MCSFRCGKQNIIAYATLQYAWLGSKLKVTCGEPIIINPNSFAVSVRSKWLLIKSCSDIVFTYNEAGQIQVHATPW